MVGSAGSATVNGGAGRPTVAGFQASISVSLWGWWRVGGLPSPETASILEE